MSDWTQGLIWYLESFALVAGVALLILFGLGVRLGALKRRWLPLPRLRPIRWTGKEVFFTFCVHIGFPVFIVGILWQLGFFQAVLGPEPDGQAHELALTIYLRRCVSLSSPLILAVTLAVIFGVLFARTQSRPHQYGLTWARWRENIALGLAAFIAGMPIVFGIHALATLILPERPHFLEELAKQNLPVWELALLFFQPMVMAPLLEEVVFRGILQGWLRKVSLIGHIVVIAVTLQVAASSIYYYDFEEKDKFLDVGPLVLATLLASGYIYAMFRVKRDFDLEEGEFHRWQLQAMSSPLEDPATSEQEPPDAAETLRVRRWMQANACLAIYGSAMVFAVFHSDAWPAPIALFPMGLLLGWLSQRTQSLLASITFHALFNLVSCIVLYMSVLSAPAENGNAQTTALRPSIVGSVSSSVPASQLPLRK